MNRLISAENFTELLLNKCISNSAKLYVLICSERHRLELVHTRAILRVGGCHILGLYRCYIGLFSMLLVRGPYRG